jgi:hypothetical protein
MGGNNPCPAIEDVDVIVRMACTRMAKSMSVLRKSENGWWSRGHDKGFQQFEQNREWNQPGH